MFLVARSYVLCSSQKPSRSIIWFASLQNLLPRAPLFTYSLPFAIPSPHLPMHGTFQRTRRRVVTHRIGWNKIFRLNTSCVTYLLSGEELNAPSESESSEFELAFPDPLPSESSSDAAFGLKSAGVIREHQEQQDCCLLSTDCTHKICPAFWGLALLVR